MNRNTAQVDLENGFSPSSRHDASGPVANPQSNDFAIEENFSQGERDYDGLAGVQSPIIEHVMNNPLRRETGRTGQTAYSDPSAKIWDLYLSEAKRIDKDHSENWTANTDGVLVSTGLFSVVVTGFIVLAPNQMLPNQTDITNSLLLQISQQLTALPQNETSASLPPLLSSLQFKNPTSSVRVNVLWFTSLAMSTACALWATLIQQWASRLVQIADRPYDLSKRARIRASFVDGVERFGLMTTVQVLPAILHLSVLLFYIGLVDFLFDVDLTVAHVLLVLVALGVLIYFVLTIMPLCYHNSPYQTPLSVLVWWGIEVASLLMLWFRRKTEVVQNAIRERRHKIGQGMRQALEKNMADNFTPQADARAIRWTLTLLNEDHELEDFLDGVSGLFDRSMGHYAQEIKPELERLVEHVADKLFATCSTSLLPERIRRQRLTVCLGVIWSFPNTIERHFRAIRDQWTQPTNDPWGPLSSETWAAATRLTDDSDPVTAIRAHCVQALIAAMWENGEWQCSSSEAHSLLRHQLRAPSAVINRWRKSEGHLQLAIAANLLSHVHPLLHLRGLQTGPDISSDVKAVLDLICGKMVETDVPADLQTRFPNSSEVMEPFKFEIEDLSWPFFRPWMRIFAHVCIGQGDPRQQERPMSH